MATPFERFDLAGRTALITGASGMLGREHAAALLEAGAMVVLTDIQETALKEAKAALARDHAAERILTRTMDVTALDMIQAVCKDLPRVDILVNNAAIDAKVKGDEGLIEASRLEQFSLAQWNTEIAVGLTGAFLCSRVFGPAMAEDGKGGVILNIASDLSVLAPDQRLYRARNVSEALQPVKPVTYSVVKAGLVGLTRYLATYWADCGVRANALSPGGVYAGQSDEFVTRITSLIPQKRMANRDEYHGVIQFLCSDASAYLNGQNIVMDGGRSVW